ncbi:hypothetical protein Tco_0210790 [Tanacetum coccineum]
MKPTLILRKKLYLFREYGVCVVRDWWWKGVWLAIVVLGRGEITFSKELLSNDSPSLPENESFHFDVPSSPRPPAKPTDDDEIEPDTGV